MKIQNVSLFICSAKRNLSPRHPRIFAVYLPVRWVEYLAKAEYESVHWSSLGVINDSDTEIFAKARDGGYVIMTRDLDFSAIIFATQASKPSVVQIRAKAARPEIIGESVINALRHAEQSLREGALLTINPLRSRLRLLPLGLRQ